MNATPACSQRRAAGQRQVAFDVRPTQHAMPHLADGQPYSATLSARGIPLVAVGWLSSVHEFDRGRVSEAFFRVLCGHLTARWEPPYACAGMHDCDLCQFGRSTTRFKDIEFGSASGSELFIPSGDSIFVAPVNIAHYIAAHHYLPPADFIRAVETCPQQRTAAYMQLLLSSGGREWLAEMDTPPAP